MNLIKVKINLFIKFCNFIVLTAIILSSFALDFNHDAKIDRMDLMQLLNQWDGAQSKKQLLQLIHQWKQPAVIQLGDDKHPFTHHIDNIIAVGDEFILIPTLPYDETIVSVDLIQTPEGMQFFEELGVILWVPPQDQSGLHNIEIIFHTGTNTFPVSFDLTVELSIVEDTAVITNAGGELEGQGILVQVPPNAVNEGSEIRFDIGKVTGAMDPQPKTNLKMISDMIFVNATDETTGLSIHEFPVDAPLQITIPFNKTVITQDMIDQGLVSAFLYDPNLEMLQVPIPTNYDYQAGTATFETTHLSRFDIAYLDPKEQESQYQLTAQSQTQPLFSVHVKKSSFVNDLQTAQRYSGLVLQGLQNAVQQAQQLGFKVPDRHIDVYIHEEGGGDGHYSPFSGAIYLDDDMEDALIPEITAHEFFHAVQDEYYVFTMANLTGVYWWTEASAVWFESQINPNAPGKYINLKEGYLRQPLDSLDKNKAYSKGTFIQWAETVYQPQNNEKHFVLEVFDQTDSITEPSPIDYMRDRLSLNQTYDDYVAYAIQTYGTGGQSNASYNGIGLIRNDNSARVLDNNQWSFFSDNEFVHKFPEQNQLTIEFDYTYTNWPFYSNLYSFISNSAQNKQIKIQYTSPVFAINNAFANIVPMVLLFDANGNITNMNDRYIQVGQEYTINRFGSGNQDQVNRFFLADVDMESGKVLARGTPLTGKWEIEIRDQPATITGIEFIIPVRHAEQHEFRTFTPGEFITPNIITDLSLEPETAHYSVSVIGLEEFNIPGFTQTILSLLWSASGIDRTSDRNTVVYGDDTVGFNNSVRDQRLPAKPLDTFNTFRIEVSGTNVNDLGNGIYSYNPRGEFYAHFVDGSIDFTYDVNPKTITPGETEFNLTISVNNQSTTPFIINSLEWEFSPGVTAFDPIREGTNTPLLVVNPTENKTVTLNNLKLEPNSFPSDVLDTSQDARLVLKGNGDNLPPTNLDQISIASYWNEARSEPVTITIVKPEN